MPAVIALLIIIAIALGTPSVRFETNLSKTQLTKIEKIYVEFLGHPKYDYIVKQHFESKGLTFVDNEKEADATIKFGFYDLKRKITWYEPVQSSGYIRGPQGQYQYSSTTYIPTQRTMGLLQIELIIETENFGYWIAKGRQGTIFAKWETILKKVLERCPLGIKIEKEQ